MTLSCDVNCQYGWLSGIIGLKLQTVVNRPYNMALSFMFMWSDLLSLSSTPTDNLQDSLMCEVAFSLFAKVNQQYKDYWGFPISKRTTPLSTVISAIV